jgi:hypothetical protein
LKFKTLPSSSTNDSEFVKRSVSTKVGSKCDDTGKAASAHPAAELAQVLPYAVPHNLPPAPPPKQQPALQQIASTTHHGG